MGELYRHALNFFSSHFAFIPPGLSRGVPLLSLQTMVAVGTRPVALGVMLVVFSVLIMSTRERLVLVVGYMCTVKTRCAPLQCPVHGAVHGVTNHRSESACVVLKSSDVLPVTRTQ